MIKAKISVTPFANITGRLLLKIPYSSHINVPNANKEYMLRDMPEVFLVRIDFIACGRNEAVVHVAAINPVIVVNVIRKLFKIMLCLGAFKVSKQKHN